jgi:predicted PurR-regulated permease PerM
MGNMNTRMEKIPTSGAAPAPDPETSTATRYVVIAIGLVGLAVMIWRLSDVFVVAFGGIVGAAVLRALSMPLSRKTKLSEHASLGIVVAVLLILLGLLSWLFGRQASEQITEMEKLLPDAWQKFTAWLQQFQLGRVLSDSAARGMGDGKALSSLGLAAGALVGGVVDAVLIFFLSIYFALDPDEYVRGLLRLLPPRRRPQVARALADAGDALKKWLLAQLVAMGVIGLLVGTGLALLGVPLALLLGVLAALLEFVPVVGPIVFAIPGVVLAFSKGPKLALYTLLLYVVVQQLESNVIIPILQRWALQLAPVVSLLAVVAGGVLFGITGIIFATPLAVVAMELIKHLYVEDTLEHPAAAGRPARRGR